MLMENPEPNVFKMKNVFFDSVIISENMVHIMLGGDINRKLCCWLQ